MTNKTLENEIVQTIQLVELKIESIKRQLEALKELLSLTSTTTREKPND
jgi:cell shape-determining protein MreC